MNVQHILRIASIAVIVSLLPACASKNNAPLTDTISTIKPIAPPTEVIVHRVKRGDRLGDIAKQYTGSIENWREIAAFNEISNPKRLLVGDDLEIPLSLTPEFAITQKDSSPKVVPTSLALKQAEPDRSAEAVDVVVQPVDNNRNFDLKPLTEIAQSPASGTGSFVKVVGSYYPKGVYSQPAPYSRLLLRVAPGTVFEFESKVNDWYKVSTDKGSGYIRLVDGLILE